MSSRAAAIFTEVFRRIPADANDANGAFRLERTGVLRAVRLAGVLRAVRAGGVAISGAGGAGAVGVSVAGDCLPRARSAAAAGGAFSGGGRGDAGRAGSFGCRRRRRVPDALGMAAAGGADSATRFRPGFCDGGPISEEPEAAAGATGIDGAWGWAVPLEGLFRADTRMAAVSGVTGAGAVLEDRGRFRGVVDRFDEFIGRNASGRGFRTQRGWSAGCRHAMVLITRHRSAFGFRRSSSVEGPCHTRRREENEVFRETVPATVVSVRPHCLTAGNRARRSGPPPRSASGVPEEAIHERDCSGTCSRCRPDGRSRRRRDRTP